MRIILAADHGGYNCKRIIDEWLREQGHETIDVGAHVSDSGDDYPDYVRSAVAQFHHEDNAKMILWCSSGVGVCMAANRHEGIYCGLGINPEQIRAATGDNALNALAIAAEFTLIDKQKRIIKEFLQTPFLREERFVRRLQKVDRFARDHLPVSIKSDTNTPAATTVAPLEEELS
ncbi:RpiB/LacA/LacB family sugar-phosphate isomerase [bacterium]|nr:RpiB/LacA/LacB family sugar-phosphate isomerase [bacterium]